MAEQKKEVVVKKPPIETASWCYRYGTYGTKFFNRFGFTSAPHGG
jgi:hypothetical protein